MALNPTGIYLFKLSNGNTGKFCEICSKLAIKIPEPCRWHWSAVFIVNFEQISHFAVVFHGSLKTNVVYWAYARISSEHRKLLYPGHWCSSDWCVGWLDFSKRCYIESSRYFNCEGWHRSHCRISWTRCWIDILHRYLTTFPVRHLGVVLETVEPKQKLQVLR